MVCWVQQVAVGGGLGWGEDLGALVAQVNRVGSEWAAELAHRGRAHHPVVAVGVVGAVPPELVAGELGGLGVVGRGGGVGGAAGQRTELEQRCWGGGAVEVAVADDRAGWVPLGR